MRCVCGMVFTVPSCLASQLLSVYPSWKISEVVQSSLITKKPGHFYLRSSVRGNLVVSITRTVHYGPRSFAVTRPSICNSRRYYYAVPCSILIPLWHKNWIVQQSLPLACLWLFNSCTERANINFNDSSSSSSRFTPLTPPVAIWVQL